MSSKKDRPAPQLPAKPREPLPGECCGRGCVPCIYDYYEKALKRWHEKVAIIKSRNQIDIS